MATFTTVSLVSFYRQASPLGQCAGCQRYPCQLLVSTSGQPGERAWLHRNAFQAAARARVGRVEAGVPCTVLRNAFYIDMFLEELAVDGVVRGPAGQGRDRGCRAAEPAAFTM